MNRNKFINIFNRKELVFVPYGADKGDCPYCSKGVLVRQYEEERLTGAREFYICDTCSGLFKEIGRSRYFKKEPNLYKRKKYNYASRSKDITLQQ